MPRVDRQTRAALAAEVTEAFCGATGHSAEILGIRFFEYDQEEIAIGGKLCSASDADAYLHLIVYCPRLKRSSKQKVGTALTEAFTRATKRPAWMPVIRIIESPYDNVIVAGKPLSDAYEACAKRSFYYELPRD